MFYQYVKTHWPLNESPHITWNKRALYFITLIKCFQPMTGCIFKTVCPVKNSNCKDRPKSLSSRLFSCTLSSCGNPVCVCVWDSVDRCFFHPRLKGTLCSVGSNLMNHKVLGKLALTNHKTTDEAPFWHICALNIGVSKNPPHAWSGPVIVGMHDMLLQHK